MAKSVTYIIKAKDAYSQVAEKVSRSTKKMTKGFQKFEGVAKDFKKIFSDIGRKVAGLGSIILSFVGITRMATKGLEFGAAVAELSAITGAAGEDLEYLSEQSLKLSKNFALAANETVNAFKLVASGKPELLENREALKDVTEQVLLLSKASGVDLATSSGVTTKALNQMGAASDQAARFVNVLAAGSKFGSSEVAETGEAVVKAGAAAKLAKLNFEELNGTIQVLAQKGISGAIAGTQLKTSLLRLETSGKKRIMPSVVGYDKALENLKKMKLTSSQLAKLFGVEAINTGLILATEGEAIAEMTKKVTGTEVAVEQARIKMQTFGFSLKRIMTSIDNVLIKVFTRIAGDDGFKQMADNFQRWIDSFSESDLDNMASFFKGLMETVKVMAKLFRLLAVSANSLGKSLANIAFLASTGEFQAAMKNQFEISNEFHKGMVWNPQLGNKHLSL